MNLCPHGEVARNCPHQVPYVNGFHGCTNIKREMLDVDWCGKIPEECKGLLKEK